jgi:hypothetical protein
VKLAKLLSESLLPSGNGDKKLLKPRQLWSGGGEAYDLAPQLIHATLPGLLLGDEAVPVGVTGVKEPGSRVFILGLGHEPVPADFSSFSAHCLAQLLKIRTGSLWSCGRSGTPAAAQGQGEGHYEKISAEFHDADLLPSLRLQKFPGQSKEGTITCCKTYFSVILNDVKDLNRLKMQDSSLRSEWP